MVTQDTSLLHRSIRSNVLYGRPEADEAELAEVVRDARADRFVPQLLDSGGRAGFEALAGERSIDG